MKILSRNGSVVADDLRYPNEAETVGALDGQIWRVHREGIEVDNDHTSETLIDSILSDYTIDNDGSIEVLKEIVSRKME